MSPEIVLAFNGGNLQPLKPDNVHNGYILGLNDNQVNRYLEVRHIAQTEQSVLKFVRDNQQAKNEVLFGIWRDGEQYHCGTVRLHGVGDIKRSAHIGLCIFDKSAWGHDLGSKAIACVTKWAIDYLDLKWIEAGIYEENIASQKAFLRAGYEWVADISGKYILDGNPVVVKIYANCKV
jgi:RimJ/RimL family protein N-acetyltransferase